MRVGFIGLGSQGGPMARRIVEGGFDLTLWARRPATLEPFADTAAKTAGSPAELAAASDLVCLCVVGDDDVREVLNGDTGVLAGLASGGIIAIHSTVHPDTCREIAKSAAEQGVSVIDAPVSGGGQAVEEGKLLVMVGGDDEVVVRCRPVFATYADRIVYLGPLGSGQVTKILNNLLFTANLGSAISALELGESLGVDRNKLCEALTGGSMGDASVARSSTSYMMRATDSASCCSSSPSHSNWESGRPNAMRSSNGNVLRCGSSRWISEVSQSE